MKKLLKKIEISMDNFKIKKKLYIMYLLCVLVPLIVTDTLVITLVAHSVEVSKRHEMEDVANTVKYYFINCINNADSMTKSIYTSKHIDTFLEQKFYNPIDYMNGYQEFQKNIQFATGVNSNRLTATFYTDNGTIVPGGLLKDIASINHKRWFEQFEMSGKEKKFLVFYDDTDKYAISPQRRMMFIQKLNFISHGNFRKFVVVDLDYKTTTNNLCNMHFAVPVYICLDGKILMSNDKTKNNYSMPFDDYVEKKNSLVMNIQLHDNNFQVIIEHPPIEVISTIRSNFPIIALLILINIILPLIYVWGFNRSFTKRLQELSDAFNKIDEERLCEISDARGRDEIGKLMFNYNKMVHRLNDLIQKVYISKMKEQEMTVARKNAELLALHSQINPHFLFNALESIRMHSIIKKEYETADMVQCLAILQRQYLEWNEDYVEIEREMEFVKHYLELQKYRFGERLSYDLEVDDSCKEYRIPKLSIVTFVENACVHGIESKSAPGWIFLRVYSEQNFLFIEVEDTGNGMEEEFMSKLLLKMRDANITMLKEKGRVGIINACLRLKMFTNNETKFELESEEGVGTIVQMKIPLIYVEQMV